MLRRGKFDDAERVLGTAGVAKMFCVVLTSVDSHNKVMIALPADEREDGGSDLQFRRGLVLDDDKVVHMSTLAGLAIQTGRDAVGGLSLDLGDQSRCEVRDPSRSQAA
jgi:hypothetical protein